MLCGVIVVHLWWGILVLVEQGGILSELNTIPWGC